MPTEIVMPALEMAQETGTLVRWLKREGDWVGKGEPVMEIETDKVTVEIEAPASGVLSDLRASAGDTVAVGHVVGLLLAQGESQTVLLTVSGSPTDGQIAPAVKLKTSISDNHQKRESRAILASPKARRLAAEHGLNLAEVQGSGPDGAVLAADLQAALASSAVAPAAEYSVVKFSGMRKIIAERLQASYQAAPHISLTSSVDMSETLRLFEQLGPTVQAQTGHSLTLTAILSRVVGAALLKHPRLNAHLIEDEIRQYSTIHLGIAVALDDGLLVPVIRNVERKDLAAVQSELRDLTERARTGKLKPHEIKGGTFTLTNLGMFGVEHFTAILNPPEVGILAVGAIQETPVGVDGQVALRPIMRVTLITDHRAVDGAVAAAFLKTLREALEAPHLLVTW